MRTVLEKIEQIKDDSSPFDGRVPSGIEVMTLSDFVKDDSEDLSEEKFLGADVAKLSTDELKDYLDRILAREKGKKEKFSLPYIHRSNVVPIVNEKGEPYDLDGLRSAFTQRPGKILKQNEKMKHSDGTASIFYNIGLPALKGLAVDESTGEFYVVNTCPGAGKCKVFCFAMKGGYVQWKASSLSATRLLNYLLNDPDGFMRQLSMEIQEILKKNAKKKNRVFIRWHDAGDFFSPSYLAKAYALAKSLPDAEFYAYTKIADVATGSKPSNFTINYSMGALPKQQQKIDFKKVKHSVVVPRELYADLILRKEVPTGKKDAKGKEKTEKKVLYKNPAAAMTLKDRIAREYDIDKNSILTYDEMLSKPSGKEGQYNVIVKPGDGDISATRRDVLGTYLLEH